MRDAQFNHESGYAMLLVFFLAAIIAVALYSELPRVAFEAQRAKSNCFIEHRRTVQARHPTLRAQGRPLSHRIEELESLNNTRFLRKRYLDPMTGKEKWRLIHINGGVLTDSVVGKTKWARFSSPQTRTPSSARDRRSARPTNTIQPQINPAMQQHASDRRRHSRAARPAAPARSSRKTPPSEQAAARAIARNARKCAGHAESTDAGRLANPLSQQQCLCGALWVSPSRTATSCLAASTWRIIGPTTRS